MMGRYRKAALGVFAAALALSLVLCVLIYNGVILVNSPARQVYPVRSADVSRRQGDIHLNVLSARDIPLTLVSIPVNDSPASACFLHSRCGARAGVLRVIHIVPDRLPPARRETERLCLPAAPFNVPARHST